MPFSFCLCKCKTGHSVYSRAMGANMHECVSELASRLTINASFIHDVIFVVICKHVITAHECMEAHTHTHTHTNTNRHDHVHAQILAQLLWNTHIHSPPCQDKHTNLHAQTLVLSPLPPPPSLPVKDLQLHAQASLHTHIQHNSQIPLVRRLYCGRTNLQCLQAPLFQGQGGGTLPTQCTLHVCVFVCVCLCVCL